MKSILMNTDMTRAIMQDRKTQTRRPIKKFFDLSLPKSEAYPILYENMPTDLEFKEMSGFKNICAIFYSKSEDKYYCSSPMQYNIGEKIWIREPASIVDFSHDGLELRCKYKADNKIVTIETPDRFLPYPPETKLPLWIEKKQGVPNGCIKELARNFIVVTHIDIQRLQDISDDDCLKEGIERIVFNDGMRELYGVDIDREHKNSLNICNTSYKDAFRDLWNFTSTQHLKWDDNPFVITYNFKRIKNEQT